jgi:hypothetical protein
MPRNSGTVKAANIRRAKSKSKLIEWEPRVHSRGVRDVPVEISAAASQPKKRKKATRRPRAENDDALQGQTAPRSMDVDEAFWPEELVIPTSEKKVRQPACPFSTSLTFLPVPE